MSGPSDFEKKYRLRPAESDADRLERMEALLDLFMTAGREADGVSRASVWVGSFAPEEVFLPLPSPDALDDTLRPFLSEEAVRADAETEETYLRMGMNPDDTSI